MPRLTDVMVNEDVWLLIRYKILWDYTLEHSSVYHYSILQTMLLSTLNLYSWSQILSLLKEQLEYACVSMSATDRLVSYSIMFLSVMAKHPKLWDFYFPPGLQIFFSFYSWIFSISYIVEVCNPQLKLQDMQELKELKVSLPSGHICSQQRKLTYILKRFYYLPVKIRVVCLCTTEHQKSDKSFSASKKNR